MKIILPVLIIAVAACGPSSGRRPASGEIALAVQPAAPSPGDSVHLTLSNRTAGQVGYNLCTSRLERQTGAGWEPIPSGRVCTMEIRGLPAGEEADYTLALPADLEPGSYRYATDVEPPDPAGRTPVASEPFRVQP